MAKELEKDVEPAILHTLRPALAEVDVGESSDFFPPGSPSPWQRLYLALRRGLEWLTALALLVLTAPVLILAALAVKLGSRGPAFYTQTRVGAGGRLFTILKLRTMIHQCESLTGPRWCIPGDPRITRIGYLLRRTHIDELPQLLNVLLGHMSLIGPRPERPEFVVQLERAIPGYRWRERVRPGITGLAQVQLPPNTEVDDVREKVAYDLYYLRHAGLWLDLRVLGATLTRLLGFSFSLSRRVWGLPNPRRIEEATMRPLGAVDTWEARQAA